MGLMDYIRGQLLEIIEWQDDTRDTIAWRYPDEDREIKRGAQLIVRESQTCQFIYLGQFGDQFAPGKHSLVTDNIPILSRLKGWKYGFESPFKTDIYYVNTRLFTGNKWGTQNPVMLRDADFGIVRLRAYGTYDFKVTNVQTFLKEVAGTDHQFTVDEFQETMRSRFVSVFSDALASAKVPALDLASRYTELGEALLPLLNPELEQKYGIELSTFVVENVSVPPEVEEAIDKRASMGAIGNMNEYIKFQMAESFTQGGGAEGGGNMAGMAAQMGAGLALGQQMAGAFAPGMVQPGMVQPGMVQPGMASPAAGSVAATPTAPGLPTLLGVAEAAAALGVSEADVLSTLEAGDLKGKKIGSTWRIKSQALEDFLNS